MSDRRAVSWKFRVAIHQNRCQKLWARPLSQSFLSDKKDFPYWCRYRWQAWLIMLLTFTCVLQNNPVFAALHSFGKLRRFEFKDFFFQYLLILKGIKSSDILKWFGEGYNVNRKASLRKHHFIVLPLYSCLNLERGGPVWYKSDL